jgi:hypothetical protein
LSPWNIRGAPLLWIPRTGLVFLLALGGHDSTTARGSWTRCSNGFTFSARTSLQAMGSCSPAPRFGLARHTSTRPPTAGRGGWVDTGSTPTLFGRPPLPNGGRDRGRAGLALVGKALPEICHSGHRPASRDNEVCRPGTRFPDESYGHHHPKTNIVVKVVWDVPVAVGAASVPLIVVPGAPTQHADGDGPAPRPSRACSTLPPACSLPSRPADAPPR